MPIILCLTSALKWIKEESFPSITKDSGIYIRDCLLP